MSANMNSYIDATNLLEIELFKARGVLSVYADRKDLTGIEIVNMRELLQEMASMQLKVNLALLQMSRRKVMSRYVEDNSEGILLIDQRSA